MKSFIHTILIVLFLFISFNIYAQKPEKQKCKKSKNEKTEVKKEKQHGPPSWAPAHGYRVKTRYVFFKEHETYYDLKKGVYISYKNGNWEISAEIPLELKNIDLEGAIQIEVEYEGDDPYKDIKLHKKTSDNQ